MRAARERRLDSGPEPGNEAAARPPAEERAPTGVDRDDLRLAVVLAQVVDTPSERAGRARGHEQVVELAVQGLVDLPHRSRRVGGWIRRVRVLVRPEGARNAGEEILDEPEPGHQQVAGLGIGAAHDPHVGAERTHAPNVRVVGPHVDDTDQLHPEVATGLREPDAHVARARLDDGAPRPDQPLRQGVAKDADGWPILGAAAGIGRFELAPHGDVGARQQALQRDERRVADRLEHAVDRGPRTPHSAREEVCARWLTRPQRTLRRSARASLTWIDAAS